MEALARQCLQAVRDIPSCSLQILSLSDGSVDEELNTVPTSVLLAHCFASLGWEAFPPGLHRVKIIGADAGNPPAHIQLQTRYHWPAWLEVHHVRLNNTANFKPQLLKCGQCPPDAKFDVVLMRQGLCYCHDNSYHSRPPQQLEVVGVKGKDASYAPSGMYTLERRFCNGRPSYRKGKFLLHWRPSRDDWILVEDNASRFIWANAVKDCGNPALAHCAWWSWDGHEYVIDRDVSCELTDQHPPWRRPPCDCRCCGGISLNAEALHGFVRRVAAVLDEEQPKAFALLHSGYNSGCQDEVQELQSEFEKAADMFNYDNLNPRLMASVIERPDGEWPTPYWKRVDGLLLHPSPLA